MLNPCHDFFNVYADLTFVSVIIDKTLKESYRPKTFEKCIYKCIMPY